MQSMNKQYVDGQISTGRCSSASEFVREFIRADEKRKVEEQFEAQLLEGLVRTESPLTPDDWSAIRKEALAKVQARMQSRERRRKGCGRGAAEVGDDGKAARP